MIYAQVLDGTVATVSGRLPNGARRLDDGNWVLGLASASTVLQEACGWFQVVETARPADTATDTFTRSVELVNGTPTVAWAQVAKSVEQVEQDRVTSESDRLRTQARAAHQANDAFIASTPTNAQVAAQVDDLTRQVNAIIRLVVAQDLI